MLAAPAVLRVDPGPCAVEDHQDRTRQPEDRSARRLRRIRRLHPRSDEGHPGERFAERRQDLSGRDHQQGQPIERHARLRSRLRTDPARQSRSHRRRFGTPDTTNPVADQAEVNEVPCITTNCPWQPYFFGRNGDPKKGFTWTYHFFWGLEDVIASYLPMWDGVDQQGRGRTVSQRCRRQCLGRSAARPAAGADARPATSSSIPAAIR